MYQIVHSKSLKFDKTLEMVNIKLDLESNHNEFQKYLFAN